MLRPDSFCAANKQHKMCQGTKNKDMLGPIHFDNDKMPSKAIKDYPVFFFGNKSPLETDLYEFHKPKSAKTSELEASYVYMLYDLTNTDVDTLGDYLNISPDPSGLHSLYKQVNQGYKINMNQVPTPKKLDSFRVQISLGTKI